MRTREEQIADLEKQFGEDGTFAFVDDRDTATKHILEAEQRGYERARAEYAAGYIFHNPDTGTEILPYHPVESGECTDATDIRLATADVLKAELLLYWEEMANSYREQMERGAECEADTRRLEWLEKLPFADIGRLPNGWEIRINNVRHWDIQPTLRGAIDAAMEGWK